MSETPNTVWIVMRERDDDTGIPEFVGVFSTEARAEAAAVIVATSNGLSAWATETIVNPRTVENGTWSLVDLPALPDPPPVSVDANGGGPDTQVATDTGHIVSVVQSVYQAQRNEL
jgi:hypothetical protein